MTRLEQLRSTAAKHNLYIATWSPGDGVTRYRFIKSKAGKPVGYFQSSGLFTVLGIGSAEEALRRITQDRKTRRSK